MPKLIMLKLKERDMETRYKAISKNNTQTHQTFLFVKRNFSDVEQLECSSALIFSRIL